MYISRTQCLNSFSKNNKIIITKIICIILTFYIIVGPDGLVVDSPWWWVEDGMVHPLSVDVVHKGLEGSV